MPVSRSEIDRWTKAASIIPDEVLRTQALNSLKLKRFHADGGSVYAAVDLRFTPQLVRLIVAFQTISDYLDNLCDRCDTYDIEDFRQLHHAMRDAVRPGDPLRAYYEKRGSLNDGGYLNQLVLTCQDEISRLAGYAAVQPLVTWLVERYCELQEIKHIEPSLRMERLTQWWTRYEHQFPDIHGWEFAAATGSTLGVFSLFLAATRETTAEEATHLYQVYFPWVTGLHILLDYLIDLEEDKTVGDFNFVQCYGTMEEAHERIRHFARKSWDHVHQLQTGGRIHRDVVKGLLGMYLSDEKVGHQAVVKPARRMLWEFGPTAWMFYGACQLYRFVR